MKIRMACFCLLLALGGCNGDYGESSASAQFDLKIEKAETSVIPGATALVLPAPPGNPAAGPMAQSCVTDAGFCPLAAATPAGRNCICQADSLMYGGKTGVQPQLITANTP
jgi:hypothetical protein